MKKVYLVLGAVALAFSGMSQTFQNQPVIEKNSYDFNQVRERVQSQDNTERSVVWSNELTSEADWTFGNDGVHPNFSWEVATGLAPSGGAPIPALESTTAGNGFAMIDSDANANQNLALIENQWMQTAAPIDLSAYSNLTLRFETQYWMWDSGESDGNEYCLVELSTDGETWPDVSTYEVEEADPGTRFELFPNMATQDIVLNPTNVNFNISEVAAGEDSVYVRFRWVGVYGYAWMIDDITICEEADFDIVANGVDIENYRNHLLTPETFTYGDSTFFDGTEYRMYPASQRPSLMSFTEFKNLGSAQDSVWVIGTLDGVEISSDTVMVAAHSIDSLGVTTFDTSALSGEFDFTLTVNSTNEDATVEDNTITTSIAFDDYLYARDDNNIFGRYPGITTDGVSGQEFFRAGNMFRIYEDATVYAVDVALMEGTENTVEMRGELYQFGDWLFGDATDPEEVGRSEDFEVAGQNYNDGGDNVIWSTFVFEDPYEAEAGEFLVPTITYLGGGDAGGVQVATGDVAPFLDSFEYRVNANGDPVWTVADRIPLVRLNFNPGSVDTGIKDLTKEETGIVLGQNRPNPANANTSVSYSIENKSEITFEITDLLGKVVYTSYEGVRPAGSYTVQFDVSQLNAGMYLYSITSGNSTVSKKMLVD